MTITKKRVETLISILTLLAENECTLNDAHEVLSYANRVIHNVTTVPQVNYRQELKCLFENLPEDDKIPMPLA